MKLKTGLLSLIFNKKGIIEIIVLTLFPRDASGSMNAKLSSGELKITAAKKAGAFKVIVEAREAGKGVGIF
ncbi:MAG: hypothetical protein R6V00_01025 [Candidatus Aminicenantes bacterium]